MSITTATRQEALPTGTWNLDPVHSSVGFEVDYMVGAFRGQFRDVDARLVVGGESARLTGRSDRRRRRLQVVVLVVGRH